MDPDVAVMHEVIEDLRGQLFKVLEPLGDADVNRSYSGLSNTIGILLRHVAGSEDYWITAVAGGSLVNRNRDAEFGHESLTKADLLGALRRTQAATERVLVGMRSEDLRAPVKAQRARGVVETTKRFAILHAIQHLAYHLGQIRLMAALGRRERGGGG
ncbi:MAG TPA: DinB family protein [bacterium]|nr:DinB family protein [bacterium]